MSIRTFVSVTLNIGVFSFKFYFISFYLSGILDVFHVSICKHRDFFNFILYLLITHCLNDFSVLKNMRMLWASAFNPTDNL